MYTLNGYECILHVYSSIIININGLDIMVTLCVYFEHNKFYVNYLLSILCPYYNFIQAILLYFLKLFQMTYIIYIILYYIIYFCIPNGRNYIKCSKTHLGNFKW
jgi:hypothetical protein